MRFDELRNSIGREPLCNHRPDRGLYIRGFCLPLCARCTGILAGAIAASTVRQVLDIHEAGLLPLILSLVMIAPTGIDGLVEYGFGIESNNPRRLVTGLIAGAGCVVLELAVVSLLR